MSRMAARFNALLSPNASLLLLLAAFFPSNVGD